MTEASITSLPESLEVGEYKARIFKLTIITKCHHCGETGHHQNSKDCMALPPPELSQGVVTFCGGKNPLSKFHIFPEGCILKDDDTEFVSSESGFEVMKYSHECLPVDSTRPTWSDIAVEQMTQVNHLKFQACDHAKQVLLDTNDSRLVELTS